ncbi:MAG: Ig-like domain-containing protein [Bacteroidota bacterium]
MNSVKNFCILSLLIIICSCANRGRPSGGEVDVDPPVIIRTTPENFTTNFDAEEIKIYFNEFVKLKDLQKQLIVSPPMDTQPEITPLGSANRYITIKIKDTLSENTTYAINFGQSIVDNNEENPYAYYRYVFSTGPTIDSLSVKGIILDAENREPDTFVSVMLYEVDSTYTDSIVYKEKPKYITNTLDSLTVFSVDNIREGTYRLVALKDENGNFTYQQKTDKIGFYDTVITVPKDTLYTIKLFKEETPFKAIRPKQIADQRLAFPYEGDYENMKIKLISKAPDSFSYRITKDPKTDSLYYWYKPKFEVDSVLFEVRNKTSIDTLTHKFRSMDADSLKITPTKTGTLNFYSDFGVEGSVPFQKIDKSKIRIMNKDSVDVPFTVTYDSLFNRYSFPFEKVENDNYDITIMPGAFTDFFEATNDTLNYRLRTKQESDYGAVRMRLINAKYPVIVQLLDKGGEVKFEQWADKDQPFDFRLIDPKTYYLRVIFDVNGNKKWDTGNYLLGIQPERISYFPGELEVRAGWDLIEEFTLLD